MQKEQLGRVHSLSSGAKAGNLSRHHCMQALFSLSACALDLAAAAAAAAAVIAAAAAGH